MIRVSKQNQFSYIGFTNLKVEAKGVVRRRSAAVRLPVQRRRLAATRRELRKSDLEKKLVRQSDRVLARHDAWQRRHTGSESNKGRGELHLDGR